MPRALISVSDKTGLADFARGLADIGFEVISTGGTAAFLREAGIPVTPVEDVTGFPEMLDGRVKTLHPKIHGGILALRTPEHLQQLAAHGITPIDLVVVNLYPFAATIARPGVTWEEAIENIDIGGPTLVRAAAKNHASVTVVVDPARYPDVLAELRQYGEVSLPLRRRLAEEAFRHTAVYDSLIAAYMEQVAGEVAFPAVLHLEGGLKQALRYGENPHQRAAFYELIGAAAGTLARAEQLQGKELSYNNLQDLEAAWAAVRDIPAPGAVVIKHTNPCGAATAATLIEAYRRAFDADPVSAFGGIVGLNRPVDGPTAAEMAKTFLEAVIAPDYTPAALEVFQNKVSLRLLRCPLTPPGRQGYNIRSVSGGFLVQEVDDLPEDPGTWQVVTEKSPGPEDWEELRFAWAVVKHVKSNAIVVTWDKVTLGVGAGQMNRVAAARIALEQAGEKARGAVLASDAFFPFSDTVEEAARAGIKAIIQPGGSVRDADSIAACDKYRIAMVFTGRRHFKH